jgi:hypothetical protein
VKATLFKSYLLSLSAFAQIQRPNSHLIKNSKTGQKMDLSKKTNKKVKLAIEALQSDNKVSILFLLKTL